MAEMITESRGFILEYTGQWVKTPAHREPPTLAYVREIMNAVVQKNGAYYFTSARRDGNNLYTARIIYVEYKTRWSWGENIINLTSSLSSMFQVKAVNVRQDNILDLLKAEGFFQGNVEDILPNRR